MWDRDKQGVRTKRRRKVEKDATDSPVIERWSRSLLLGAWVKRVVVTLWKLIEEKSKKRRKGGVTGEGRKEKQLTLQRKPLPGG